LKAGSRDETFKWKPDSRMETERFFDNSIKIREGLGLLPSHRKTQFSFCKGSRELSVQAGENWWIFESIIKDRPE
jgi:hypothetical protein